jgi:outer membrane biosynthesis protein TonB
MKERNTVHPQRTVAVILVVALLGPFMPMAGAQQQAAQPQPAQLQSLPSQRDQQAQQPAQDPGQQPAPANQPGTPDAPVPAQQPTQQPAAQQSAPLAPGLETRPAADPQQRQDNPNARPVGTAAAPATRPTGTTASRPAGAAIAPAKQRRVKPILIRIGIIVGAAAAVGAVAGLSKSSSSRP